MQLTDIVYRKDEFGVATITLNRPDLLNAFTREMIDGWVWALEDAQRDDNVRVIVVTATGRAFCVGGNIKTMAAGEGFFEAGDMFPGDLPRVIKNKKALFEHIHRVALTLENVDKPVIASVNGDAVGAGCDMALMCDLRIASDKARFSEGYVRVGLVPGDGGAYFLPRLVGIAKALELLWTGEFLSAAEAERIGLVNRVVPHEKLVDETAALARRLAAGPPLAMRMIKRAVYQSTRCDLRTALDLISSHMAIIAETEDHRDGVKAIMEKKKPEFKGR